MFENLFSFGSLLAVTLSISLTIKMLKININNNQRHHSHNVSGNNNVVVINQIYSKEISDFKRLSNIIVLFLLFLFPMFPVFFIQFLSMFALCSVIICFAGVCKNILEKKENAIYGVFYVPLTVFIAFLSITAIYTALANKYIFVDYYSRLKESLSEFSLSLFSLENLNSILGEGLAYVGFSLIFAGLIHTCFGFITKGKNFDATVDFMKSWIPFSLVGHFLASGCFTALFNSNFGYIAYVYKDILSHFYAYFI